MKTGMLWFDNDPKTNLAAKIIRAVEYYTKKYGRVPNLCLIHPSMLPPDPPAAPLSPSTTTKERGAGDHGLGGIMVRPYRPVLPGHLWIGIEEAGWRLGSAARYPGERLMITIILSIVFIDKLKNQEPHTIMYIAGIELLIIDAPVLGMLLRPVLGPLLGG